MTLNPKIKHIRGYIPDIDRNALNPSNMLSPTELISPYTAVHSDPVRAAMQISQTKHTIPVKDTDPMLITSCMSKTLAWTISDDFAFKAKKLAAFKSCG